MMLIRAYTPAEFTAFTSEADVDWRELARAYDAEIQAGHLGRGMGTSRRRILIGEVGGEYTVVDFEDLSLVVSDGWGSEDTPRGEVGRPVVGCFYTEYTMGRYI